MIGTAIERVELDEKETAARLLPVNEVTKA
jgi:hypothetical protein